MANVTKVGFFRMGLMAKLIVFFLLVALLPTATVAWLSFRNQKASLEKAEYNRLDEARQLRKTELFNYVQQTYTNMKFLATTPSALQAFRKLTGSADSGEVDELSSDLRAKVMADMERLISRWRAVFGMNNGYEDVLLINAKGDIVYTHKGGLDLEENVTVAESLKDSALRRLWDTIMKTQKPGMVDFSLYKPGKSVSAFMGVPVIGQTGMPSGALFLRLGPERINKIFKVNEENNKGVRVYLVGTGYTLRSNVPSGDEKTGISNEKVETLATRNALQGKSGRAVIEDGWQIDLCSTRILPWAC